MTMPDSHPDTEAGRWLTYRQIADLRRISKASAERLVRRHKWRRQEDNQGVTRALVPPEWADAHPGRLTDSSPDIRRDGAPDITPSIAAFEAALAAMHGAKDAAISTLREANATLREQLAQSVTLIDGFREERDRAQARADHAEAARDRAEQGRDAGRAGADALRDRVEAREADLALIRAALDQTQAEARKAHAEVETLRRAEAERKARGLVARLRATWRGE
jgi:ABC-type transporter Mla subunit MlaD